MTQNDDLLTCCKYSVDISFGVSFTSVGGRQSYYLNDAIDRAGTCVDCGNNLLKIDVINYFSLPLRNFS